jgi:hypothetical protein
LKKLRNASEGYKTKLDLKTYKEATNKEDKKVE